VPQQESHLLAAPEASDMPAPREVTQRLPALDVLEAEALKVFRVSGCQDFPEV
jgi:hypothetical protein